MKADGFIKEILIYRNLVGDDRFRITLADKQPEGSTPTFKTIETIMMFPDRTEILVYGMDRPVYYVLPDGTRRKIHYHKKKDAGQRS